MKFKKRFILAFICFVLFSSIGIAHASSERVVKVGFPIQYGISYIDDDGNYAGYMYDYLEQLSLYTNWDYEFVLVEGDTNTQISKLLNMLIDGEIDMLGTMNRNAAMEELFLYPNSSYGTTCTALTVKEDSKEWLEEDFSHWNGMRVAVYSGQQKRLEQLEQYANLNGFTYELVQCETLEDSLNAVLNGDADATLQVDIAIKSGFRTIAQFSPTPYYFALSKENVDLLQTLNTALYNMYKAYPHLQTELYNEYFHSYGQFVISERDKQYIKELGEIKVLFCDGNAPFQYVKDGELKGLAITFFDQFAEEIGLDYEPVIVNSCQEGIKLIEQGKADIVACAATSSAYIAADGMKFSMPYFTGSTVSVSTNKGKNTNSEEQFYTNTQYILNKMRNNSKELARLDFYSVNYYLQKKMLYDEINVNWSSEKNISYSMGISERISDRMINVMNQYTNSFSASQMQNILYQNMAEGVEYTFSESLYVNRYLIITILILLIFIICIYILYRNNKLTKYQVKMTQNKLEHLSRYDETTGAYNGVYFRTLLTEKCNNHVPLALNVLNIRNFKYINETYGVLTADKVLCNIKECLDSVIKPEEFFCRESADIFYLALDESSSDKLIKRIHEIYKMIQEKCNDILDQYKISMSCGSVFTEKSPEPFSATANMNYIMVALAQTKKKKQNDICIYNEKLHKSEQIRSYVENNMQRALDEGEFEVYLQPKINLADRNLMGAEALVRWKSKDRGMIYPDQFIPVFEENGFCVKLDLYMVEQVCKQIRHWIDNGLPSVHISVNQTRLLFTSEGYVEKLLAITNKYSVSPKYITLEILESIAIDNIASINSSIEKLRAYGFRISMDDFGSGYSSLNTLGKLKIDELKLDRLFLMGVTNDKKGIQRKIMASILSLAKQLNIDTVAEGVETEQDENMISQLNCDYGQGYYYSRPISVQDFEQNFL